MFYLHAFCCVIEYKKAKQELKKATAETNKWQKKVKKGELGEQKFLLKRTHCCLFQRDTAHYYHTISVKCYFMFALLLVLLCLALKLYFKITENV